MRQVLADHAKAQRRIRRGGGAQRITLDEHVTPSLGALHVDVVALDDSLRRLAELNERHAEVVAMRVLGGMTVEETAEALGISPATVKVDWAMARAWLRDRLE